MNVDSEVVDTTRGPLPIASTYKAMYAYGNHYRVRSSEQARKTSDSGVATTFKQVCRNGMRDNNQVQADVEYVGHIEEILELNYRRHCLVVLVCDFVKSNYSGDTATIKKDRWGFTLANYRRRYGSICRDSFAFPIHCEQVYYSEALESPGWQVVLRKEVRGKRVVPNNSEDVQPQMFEMGIDEDFDGLRPDREVGEGQVPAAATGETVVLEPIRRRRRQSGGGSNGLNGVQMHSGPNSRGRNACGRGVGRIARGRGAGMPSFEVGMNETYDDVHERMEEDILFRNNLREGSAVGRTQQNNDVQTTAVPERQKPEEVLLPRQESSSEEKGSSSMSSSSSSIANSSDDENDYQANPFPLFFWQDVRFMKFMIVTGETIVL